MNFTRLRFWVSLMLVDLQLEVTIPKAGISDMLSLVSMRLAFVGERLIAPTFFLFWKYFESLALHFLKTITMAKRKAEDLSQAPSMNGSKKLKQEIKQQAKPNLLDDSDSDDSDESLGGVKLDTGFKINEDYAKKFEHNSKRAELHRRN